MAVGVTVTVAVTGDEVALVAVKEAMLPLPLAARPTEVVLFVHAKVVPATAPLKLIVVVLAPLHTACDVGAGVTVGVGLTVIVKFCAVPEQKFATGVTVKLATTGLVPELAAVKEPIFPLPLAARPIEVVLFVQK